MTKLLDAQEVSDLQATAAGIAHAGRIQMLEASYRTGADAAPYVANAIRRQAIAAKLYETTREWICAD